jgi:hypothetical protein
MDLVPLVSDPASQVRTAARFALLRSAEVEAARMAFLDLLRERNDYLDDADFDHRRLLCTEVAEVLLAELVEEDYAPERFWRALRAEDLRPLLPRIEELWPKPVERGFVPAGPGQLRKALAFWLVRVGEPRVDRLLVEAIRRECPDELEWESLADEILAALLDRSEPLAGDGALETVLRSAETAIRAERGIPAHLVLLRWKVPGAAEKLLARLREPDNDWLDPMFAQWKEHVPSRLLPALESLAAE